MNSMLMFALSLIAALTLSSCVHTGPYDRGEYQGSPRLRRAIVPLPPGTPFVVRQGAFGSGSHNDPGNQFNWDLEFPLGTPIVSVDDGVVESLYQPEGAKGGPNPAYAIYAWNVHIVHADMTMAQYAHVEGTVKVGQQVKKGEAIGRTVWLGWMGYPHVHFGVYRSVSDGPTSPTMETLPIYFEGVERGLLLQGKKYIAP